ncbi:MAG: AMP-binding protein [Rhodobacteraceae bacterium]|nr:AMP-binding protein [Paracoccaceae bacterium]MCY4195553.1 AMP-binding protein [Paracoccaceae bacterium]
MTNPLYDRLFAAHANNPQPLFHLTDGQTVTYRNFLVTVGQIAHILTRIGMKPGDRIVFQAEKSVEAIAVYAACAQVGLIFVPLNHAFTDDETSYFIADSGAALVICTGARAPALRSIANQFSVQVETLNSDGSGSLMDKAATVRSEFPTCDRNDDDVAAILYTSGTTGQPKGAMLTQRNLLSNAEILTREWRLTAQDCLLHALPIYHTHGLFVAINVMLVAGGCVILLPKFDLDTIIARLPDATTMMGVPTFYTRLLDDARFTRERASHMRLFISGSAPLLPETHAQFQARTGHHILERYGLTETGMNCSNPYEGERRPGTVGFPLPNVELLITDPENGTELSQGDIGQIEVRGPHVFQGYWQRAAQSAAVRRDNGFFRTGDLGRVDTDGYVHIVGRIQDLIISGGENIYPKEIETHLNAQPGVKESAVIGIPHPDLGEAAVAVIIPEDSCPLDALQIMELASASLAPFKRPRKITFCDHLPRNAMGKVQKNILRQKFADEFTD